MLTGDKQSSPEKHKYKYQDCVIFNKYNFEWFVRYTASIIFIVLLNNQNSPRMDQSHHRGQSQNSCQWSSSGYPSHGRSWHTHQQFCHWSRYSVHHQSCHTDLPLCLSIFLPRSHIHGYLGNKDKIFSRKVCWYTSNCDIYLKINMKL